MSARVYVAAPFSEYKLVREVQAALRERGAVITEDWTAGIESLPPGVTDGDVSEEVALAAAIADLRGVATADACIFLTVPDKTKGRGMWIEMGFALGRLYDRSGAPIESFHHSHHLMRIAVCGPHRDSTIFSRLGRRFADWHDAIPYVLGES